MRLLRAARQTVKNVVEHTGRADRSGSVTGTTRKTRDVTANDGRLITCAGVCADGRPEIAGEWRRRTCDEEERDERFLAEEPTPGDIRNRAETAENEGLSVFRGCSTRGTAGRTMMTGTLFHGSITISQYSS